MNTVAWVLSKAKFRYGVDLKQGAHPVCCDCDGLGKGVADRLAEMGVWILPHKGSESADDKRQYSNRRAETFSLLALRLDPSQHDSPWALPDDQQLLDELCAMEKIMDSDGVRFRLQPKHLASGQKPHKNHRGEEVQSLVQKLGRSPDKGDAIGYLYRAVHLLHYGDLPQPQMVRDDEFLCWTPEMAAEMEEEETKKRLDKHNKKPDSKKLIQAADVTEPDDVDLYLAALAQLLEDDYGDEADSVGDQWRETSPRRHHRPIL